jgi:hypothetical protein
VGFIYPADYATCLHIKRGTTIHAKRSIGIDRGGKRHIPRCRIVPIGPPLHPIDTTGLQGVLIVGQDECAIRHTRDHLQFAQGDGGRPTPPDRKLFLKVCDSIGLRGDRNPRGLHFGVKLREEKIRLHWSLGSVAGSVMVSVPGTVSRAISSWAILTGPASVTLGTAVLPRRVKGVICGWPGTSALTALRCYQNVTRSPARYKNSSFGPVRPESPEGALL